MKWGVLLIFICFAALARAAETDPLPFQFYGSFGAKYGSTLDAKDNQGALTFEPSVVLPFDGIRRIELNAVIDRPADIYRNFEIPRVSLVYSQRLTSVSDWKVSMQGGVNALNLERWRLDGHQVRFTPSGEIWKEIYPSLKLYLRAGPFLQWNGYTQTAQGNSLPTYGLQERVRLTWEYADFGFDLRFLMAQSRAGSWKNDYATSEAITYRILPGVKVGISHELESSVVDETTGRARSLQLFDTRVSRLSALMELEL